MTSVRPDTPIHEAGWIIAVPSAPGNAHTLPQGFHGKPLSTNSRARSPITQPPASSDTRRQPGWAKHASAQAKAMKGASSSAVPGTANGTSHQYSPARSRIASVIQ